MHDWLTIADRLNAGLRDIQYELECEADPIRPIVHVVGPPRSGTTLAMQLLTSSTDVGYVDNLAANFWRVPAVGILLSQQVNKGRRSTTWDSRYGRTALPHEPHEFGYFWRERLHYRSMTYGDAAKENIDWMSLQRTIASMTTVSQSPFVFKSFLAAWHLSDLRVVMPETLVVRVRRNYEETAHSILGLREWLGGSERSWASVKPPMPLSIDEWAPFDQAVAQAYMTNRMIDWQLESYPADLTFEINYDELCAYPASIVSWLEDALTTLDHPVRVDTSGVPSSFATRGRPEARRPNGAIGLGVIDLLEEAISRMETIDGRYPDIDGAR